MRSNRRRSGHRAGITKQRSGAGESTLVLGNVVVAGHRTSVRLEPAIWEALEDIVQREAKNLNELVTQIDRTRSESLQRRLGATGLGLMPRWSRCAIALLLLIGRM